MLRVEVLVAACKEFDRMLLEIRDAFVSFTGTTFGGETLEPAVGSMEKSPGLVPGVGHVLLVPVADAA